MPRFHNLLVAALVVLMLPTGFAAMAQDAGKPSLLGTFGDWEALTFKEGKARVCYMGSRPKKAVGKYTKRGDVFFLVTHRPAEKAVGVVEIRAGYAYKENSEPSVTIGSDKFLLFTDGGSAFARDSDTDHALAKAMVRGSTMVVQGMSSRGTLTTDTYSLKGFTAAYKAINEACEVK